MSAAARQRGPDPQHWPAAPPPACLQGRFYREPHSGKLAVVLGAGAKSLARMLRGSAAAHGASAGCTAPLALPPAREQRSCTLIHGFPQCPACQFRSHTASPCTRRCCPSPCAGNQHFLALSDVLHMVFVEGCVVILKYHPIMAVRLCYFLDFGL